MLQQGGFVFVFSSLLRSFAFILKTCPFSVALQEVLICLWVLDTNERATSRGFFGVKGRYGTHLFQAGQKVESARSDD